MAAKAEKKPTAEKKPAAEKPAEEKEKKAKAAEKVSAGKKLPAGKRLPASKEGGSSGGKKILAIYTIRTWLLTVLENVNSLVRKTAAPEFLQKLTYLCWNHHKAIRHIDTVRAYTFGSRYFVEVDIVLPADMPLREAHDIGEALQEKLELLPDVERAFVHLDYEYTHRPEHSQAHDS